MKNKLHYSFLLGLTIIGSLLLLSYLSEFFIGPYKFKKIDPLADIKTAEDMQVDSLVATVTKLIPEVKDSVIAKQDSILQEIKEKCKPGLTCIEDYSSDTTALKDFLQALSKTKEADQKLRIAFYGDSFIEGDVFCGSFRDTLQSVFGGSGVGYVPITSTVTGFRNTIKHRLENWETFSLIKQKDSPYEIGPAGFSFIPLNGNWVEYKPSRQRYLREFNTIKLFYKNFRETILYYTIDTVESLQVLEASGQFEEWNYHTNKAKLVRFEFYPFDSLMVYGASFESKEGIQVDNFSVRGNSGLNLGGISAGMYKDFNRYRNYKLIILQFGLNLVVSETLNYKAYVSRMVAVIHDLKKVFPNASFLLLSVSDRSENINGEYKTMSTIPIMRDAQRLIAQEAGIAFWDMYEAMGGENSMVKWTEAKQPLGARDYTHLTFKGGRKLAGYLAKSLLYESEKHEKRENVGRQ